MEVVFWVAGGMILWFAGAYVVPDVLTTRRLRGRRRGSRSLRAARVAISDMVVTKERIRQEERQRWSERFEEFSGGQDWRSWLPGAVEARSKKALKKAEKAGGLLQNAHGGPTDTHERYAMLQGLQARQRQAKREHPEWDGMHLTTCPYECDCPQMARLPS